MGMISPVNKVSENNSIRKIGVDNPTTLGDIYLDYLERKVFNIDTIKPEAVVLQDGKQNIRFTYLTGETVDGEQKIVATFGFGSNPFEKKHPKSYNRLEFLYPLPLTLSDSEVKQKIVELQQVIYFVYKNGTLVPNGAIITAILGEETKHFLFFEAPLDSTVTIPACVIQNEEDQLVSLFVFELSKEETELFHNEEPDVLKKTIEKIRSSEEKLYIKNRPSLTSII